MKIIDGVPQPLTHSFDTLSVGDGFIYQNRHYTKIHKVQIGSTEGYYNALCLENHEVVSFNGSFRVFLKEVTATFK